MAENKYNLTGVHHVAMDEVVGGWHVRGEKEGGWASVIVDFRKDQEEQARALAVEWCNQLG